MGRGAALTAASPTSLEAGSAARIRVLRSACQGFSQYRDSKRQQVPLPSSSTDLWVPEQCFVGEDTPAFIILFDLLIDHIATYTF